MKIEEAKELCQLQLESLMSNPQVTLDPKYIQAERMAIASLEEWEKVKAEIDEQYDRVHPYNISCAEGLEMALEIIDKHLHEVESNE